MRIRVSNITFSRNNFLVKHLLAYFPDTKVNEAGVRLSEEDLVGFFSDADGVIVGLEMITSRLLDKLPNLKIIAKYGVGLDNIDLEACKQRNIQIGWTGGVNKRAVAELTIGLLISLCRNLFTTSFQLKNNKWNKAGGIQLTGKTIGIIGLGNIGKELVSLLGPFNCKILANDIIAIRDFASLNNIRVCEKNEIFEKSDFISLHTPLTSLTKNMITMDVFKKMKPSSFLINTARGGIVNEEDLKYALMNGIIAGAAFDVFEQEPPEDLDLLNLDNFICTPHIGGNSMEAVVEMGISAIDHLLNFKLSKIQAE